MIDLHMLSLSNVNILNLSCEFPRLSLRDNKVILSGTPWHGSATYADPQSVELSHLLFLQHGKNNRLQAFSSLEASARLTAASIIPYWDHMAVPKAVQVTAEACMRCKAAMLEFRPDKTTVEFLENADM